MKIKKKLTRKQFLAQDDEFIVFMRNAVRWVKGNVNFIILGLAGIIIALGGVWGIRYKQKSNFSNSAKLLSELKDNFTAMVVEKQEATPSQPGVKNFKTKEEKYTAAIESSKQIIDLYPSSKVAEDAVFLKAEAYYHLEKYDEAISTYQQYLDKYNQNGNYTIQALASIGYSYEGKKDYQKAIDSFQKIIDSHSDYPLRDAIFIELGRCYEHIKQTEKAKEAYQKIVMNFSDSPILKDAQSRLEALGSPVPPAEKKPVSEDKKEDSK